MKNKICDQAKINPEIKVFSKEAFKCHQGKLFLNPSNILNSIDLHCLTNKQKDFYEIELWEKELCNALKSMPNSKTSGMDWLSKEVLWSILERIKRSPDFITLKLTENFLPHKGKS